MIERYCRETGCPGGDGCISKNRKPGLECLSEYVASELGEEFRWKGEGPPPRKWMVGNTLVYRSYADYCD